MKYEVAKVFAPNGDLLAEHPRTNARRAMRSAKLAGIRVRRIDTHEFDTVCEYAPGTVIEAGPLREQWDGESWADAPKAGGAS